MLNQRPAGGISGSDIVPGVVAAVAFVGMVVFLPVPLLVSAALAGGIYFGVRLLLPTPAPTVDKGSELRGVIAEIARESAVLPPYLSAKATAICKLSAELLYIADSNPARATDITLSVQEYLRLIQQAITLYREPGRATTIGPQTRANLESLLDSVHERLDALRDGIVREDDAQTAQEMDTLNRTVKDMDDVLVQLRGKGGVS